MAEPTITVRLPVKNFEALTAVSTLTGRSVSDLVRQAVNDLIDSYVDGDPVGHPEVAEREAAYLSAVDLLRDRAQKAPHSN